MKAATKTKIHHFARACIAMDSIFAAIFWGLAIVLFFGYAIYSAAHHVQF